MLHTVEIDLDGQKITLETGKIAKQSNGSVIVRSGDTVVLVSACANEEPKPGAAFFPLTVDYREYTYAAGKFPGGFIKREGRPSEKEILTSRLIDRPIRPLFPEGFMNESQVIAMVLSADPKRDPSTLAIVGAGAALAISDIPFQHILGGVRVGLVGGKMIPNPSYDETREAKVNIVVAGTEEGIVMVEAGAEHATEDEVLRGHRVRARLLQEDRRRNSCAGRQGRQEEVGSHAAGHQQGPVRAHRSPDPQRADRRARHQEISQARKLPSRSRSQEEGRRGASRGGAGRGQRAVRPPQRAHLPR